MARIVGAGLTERWGQQVLVDNRLGKAEIIGTDLAAKANPNGYTLMLIADSTDRRNRLSISFDDLCRQFM